MDQQDRDMLIRMDENLRHVKENVEKIERGAAAQWEKIDASAANVQGLRVEVEGLTEKVNDHISGHWKWGAFIMGTPAAVWAIFQTLKAVIIGGRDS